MIVWGSRLYGKVDEAPELFHVATLFGHLWFVPLVPMKSYLVLKKEGGSFQGKAIPLSWKSVFLAWLQGLSVLGAFFILIGALNLTRQRPLMLAMVVLSGLCLGAFLFLRFSKGIRRASYERACELGAIAGLTPEGKTLLEFAFGRISEEEARQAMKEKISAFEATRS